MELYISCDVRYCSDLPMKVKWVLLSFNFVEFV